MRERRVHRSEERLEDDGETHRLDCGCARCEAGFRPTERERAVVLRRRAMRQGRAAAVRAWARREETERRKQMDMEAYFEGAHAAVEAEVARLRALRARAMADRRAEELLALRREGMPWEAALEEVERRFPPGDAGDEGDAPGNDNSRVGAGTGAGGTGKLIP